MPLLTTPHALRVEVKSIFEASLTDDAGKSDVVHRTAALKFPLGGWYVFGRTNIPRTVHILSQRASAIDGVPRGIALKLFDTRPHFSVEATMPLVTVKSLPIDCQASGKREARAPHRPHVPWLTASPTVNGLNIVEFAT